MKTSLIVCSRNRAAQLRVMLERLDGATMRHFDIELILVDSASQDETPQIMVDFARAAPMTARVYRAPRAGLGFARNIGIANATGDLLCFTDDDCYLEENYFPALLAAFASERFHYGMGQILRYDPTDDPRVAQACIESEQLIAPGTILPTGVIQGANIFFRREVFEKAGMFREDMGAGTPFPCEDIEMGLRASQAGFTGVLLPSVIVFHHHGRKLNSPEAQATCESYERGRGAYYASALVAGVADTWHLWRVTTQMRGPLPLPVIERLEREFRGAADWLAHVAALEKTTTLEKAKHKAPAPRPEGSLWVRREDLERLRFAPLPLLIGGYDGSRNFGDLVQCAAVAAAYASAGQIGIVGTFENRATMTPDMERAFPAQAVPVYHARPDESPEEAGLVPLTPPGPLVLHFYGGGYLNDAWGESRRRMALAALNLHRAAGQGMPEIVFSGLQVSPGLETPRWKPLFEAARHIGVRDRRSQDLLETILSPAAARRVAFTGDDALPAFLKSVSPRRTGAMRRIGLHVNGADYSTGDFARRLEHIADVIGAQGAPLACDLLIAYASEHVNEREAARRARLVLEARGGAIAFQERDLYAEALKGGEIRMDYDLVISCSYHVALAGIVAGCPVVLLAENGYYGQKARGLRDQAPCASLAVLSPGEPLHALEAAAWDCIPALQALTALQRRAVLAFCEDAQSHAA